MKNKNCKDGLYYPECEIMMIGGDCSECEEYIPDPEPETNCPNCKLEYDEIDYEFQICHICKYENK